MKLTSLTLASIFDALGIAGRGGVASAFDELEVDDGAFTHLASRYKAARELQLDWGRNHVVLASWLVAKIGPSLNLSTTAFEALVENCAGGRLDAPLVAPKWVLSAPVSGALQRRCPCWPFVQGEDPDLYRAYEGLLQHVAYVVNIAPKDQTLELLNTSIPWRIIALADRLETERVQDEGIASKLARLRRRTVDLGLTTEIEKSWWRSIDQALVARRHVLSHLCERDGWTFSRCVDEMWSLETAMEATAGIGLSVMAEISKSIREGPPETSAFNAVMDETSWLDEHI